MTRDPTVPPNRGHGEQGQRRSYIVAGVVPAAWQPNVDVYETNEAVVVIVEIAGINPDMIELSVEGRVLRIQGARVPRFRAGYRGFHQLEISQGLYERAVRLPAGVDGEAAEAQYDNGLLEIVLPLVRPVRPQVTTRISEAGEQ